MKKLLIINSFFIIANCTLKIAINHHGVHYLEKKEKTFSNKQIKMI